jgi:hypothetical protein
MQIIPLNQYLIENYVLPEQEIKNTLEQIAHFIDHIEDPFEEQKANLTTLSLVEIAFKHFQSLESATQRLIFGVTQRLASKSIALCYDKLTAEQYQRIVSIWAQWSHLQTAISDLCIFLTPARYSYPLTTEQLTRAQCLIQFAIQHFRSLEANLQMSIHCLAQIIKNPPLPDVSKESLYQFLISQVPHIPRIQATPLSPSLASIQAAPLSSLTPRGSPLIWQEPISSPAQNATEKNVFKSLKHFFVPPPLSLATFEEGCNVLSPQTSAEEETLISQAIEKELKESHSNRKLQLEKICLLSKQLLQSYFPLSWLGDQIQQQQFFKEFDERYASMAKELFFSSPSPVSPLQFQMIQEMLHQGVRFLQNLNKKESIFSQLSKPQLDELLAQLLESAFQRWQPQPSPLNSFLSFLKVKASLRLIDQFLNPDGFYFLLDRLLSPDMWDLEDFNMRKVPLELFETNQELTEEWATLLEALSGELILLGQPEGVAKAVIKTLRQIVKVKKHSLARTIQQLVQQIKRSPSCSMMPLLVAHHLLLRKEQDQIQAAWFQWQSLDLEQKKLRKQAIEKALNDRLYDLIVAEIKKQSTLTAWVVENASSIKAFCQQLTQRLWSIFQQEETIKFLALYLLQGMERAFSKMDRAHPNKKREENDNGVHQAVINKDLTL